MILDKIFKKKKKIDPVAKAQKAPEAPKVKSAPKIKEPKGFIDIIGVFKKNERIKQIKKRANITAEKAFAFGNKTSQDNKSMFNGHRIHK